MEQGSDKAQCGGGILCADVDGLAVDPACPIPEIARLGGPYASGRTHSTTTSTPTEQATAPRKPSTDIIELGRRTARGYRNPTNYQLRMLLIAGGLDASTHTQH